LLNASAGARPSRAVITDPGNCIYRGPAVPTYQVVTTDAGISILVVGILV
jgi:hypothetical protein